VAGFTAHGRSIRLCLPHPLVELSFVRIGVATGARQTLPVVGHGGFGLELRGFLVAVAAGHRDVSAGKNEMGFLMACERERGRFVPLKVVTAIAGVEVGRRGKLIGVPVGVAIGAALELDLEQRVLSLRNVALRALQPGVPAFQRVRGSGMILYRELRRLPAFDCVA